MEFAGLLEKAGTELELIVEVRVTTHHEWVLTYQPDATHDFGTMFTFQKRFTAVCLEGQNWLARKTA